MREATSSIDSTCRNEDDSRALLLEAPALGAEDVLALCDGVLGNQAHRLPCFGGGLGDEAAEVVEGVI